MMRPFKVIHQFLIPKRLKDLHDSKKIKNREP